MEDTRPCVGTLCYRSETTGTALCGFGIAGHIRRSRNASYAGECIITHSQTTPSLLALARRVINLREYATARSACCPFSYLCTGACIAGGMQVSREGASIFVSDISFKSLGICIKRIRKREDSLSRRLENFQALFQVFCELAEKGKVKRPSKYTYTFYL